ncbi:MAG: YcgJ family protein [Geminicoccaceae bacterium]|nr:YcgJ family protein [Geminicoccaceae bacterium]MCS7268020.1 YcgJ family protein [Geminicoccaceae bacterium]MCX7629793.1 YcgJ family protein [Geminicoccaceae bacterium]MDW8125780.1 YcgJ family protein [Geminicoccaceae bacterium]MDW8341398.1 YcgJ family protein [Geminicoccaceae bacterium]
MFRARSALLAAVLLSGAACSLGPPGPWDRPFLEDGWGRRSVERWSEPRPGVRCDRFARVCYDRNGPELSLTREYFGKEAAKELEERIGGDWRRDTVYEPAPRVRCDLEDELCTRRGEPDYRATREQFGRKPALAVTEPDGTIRPDRRTICDPARELCVRDGRPSVDRTRYVFGDRAARKLKKQLEE